MSIVFFVFFFLVCSFKVYKFYVGLEGRIVYPLKCSSNEAPMQRPVSLTFIYG